MSDAPTSFSWRAFAVGAGAMLVTLALVFALWTWWALDALERKAQERQAAERQRSGSPSEQSLESPRAPRVMRLQTSDYSWSFERLDGSVGELRDFSGKALLIQHFATWCAPCVAELPSLTRLSKVLPSDRFEVLVISDQARETLAAFAARQGDGLPIVRSLSPPPSALQVHALPTTYLVHPSGVILMIQVGAAQWDAPEFVSAALAATAAPLCSVGDA